MVPAGVGIAASIAVIAPVASFAASTDPVLACSVSVANGQATVTWNDIGQTSNYIYDHGVAKTDVQLSYVDSTPEWGYEVVAIVNGVKVRASCSTPGTPTTTTAQPTTTTAQPTTTTAAPTTTTAAPTTTAQPTTTTAAPTTTTAAPGGTLVCSVSVAGGVATVTWNNIGQASSYVYDSGVAVTDVQFSYVDSTPAWSYRVVAVKAGVKYRADCTTPGTPTTTTAAPTTTTAQPTTTTAAPTTTTARPTTTTVAPTTTTAKPAPTCNVTAGAQAGSVQLNWNIEAGAGSSLLKTPGNATIAISGKTYVDFPAGDFYDLTIVNGGTAYSVRCTNNIPWVIPACTHQINRVFPGNEALFIYSHYNDVPHEYEVFDVADRLLSARKPSALNEVRGDPHDRWYPQWSSFGTSGVPSVCDADWLGYER